MTCTLQQEGGRKLRLSSSQVMRVAQGLYERGYITYMRTDNVDAVGRGAAAPCAPQVATEYGAAVPVAAAQQYTSKVKNAQEAHEAIRPTTPLRSPDQVGRRAEPPGAGAVPADLAAHAGLADGRRHRHDRDASASGPPPPTATDAEFAASGTTITFPGYRQVYVESRDEGEADARRSGRRCCRRSPSATSCRRRRSSRTATRRRRRPATPRRRWSSGSRSSASAARRRGRRSSRPIQDRGYVWKKGQALVPTWTAFAVVGLLEQHFDDLVDYEFTARVETDLDAIAAGERQKDQWLQRFYFGDDALPGLKRLVEENLDEIDAAAINTFPHRRRPRRRRGRRQAGPVRALRQAGRRHRQRARGPRARRADARPGARAARRAEVRRADRRARRLPGVRQERALRALRAVGHARRPAAGSRQAEDVEPVQDDGARADHASTRPRRCCRCPARSASTPPTASRSSPTTGATGPTSRRARTTATWRTRSSCSRSRSTRRWPSSPSPRCSAAAARTWPPRVRCGSSAPTRSASARSSPRTAASACTSPTARPTRRSARATASRRWRPSGPSSCWRSAARRSPPRAARRRRKKAPAKKAPAKKPPEGAGRPSEATAKKSARPASAVSGPLYIALEGAEGCGKSTQAALAGRRRSAPSSPGRPAAPRSAAGSATSSTTPTSPTSPTAPRR